MTTTIQTDIKSFSKPQLSPIERLRAWRRERELRRHDEFIANAASICW